MVMIKTILLAVIILPVNKGLYEIIPAGDAVK